jgi:acetoin utilization protein AcuC
MRQVALIASSVLWEHGHAGGHPLRPERLRRTVDLMAKCGLLARANVTVVPPRLATDEELGLFHTPEYIDAVRRLSRGERELDASRFNFGPGDNPVFSGMFDSEAAKAGGALLGAERLVSGQSEVAFNLGGGLHHAWRDHASGFCVFNDAAIAIQWLVNLRWRVAYLDFDVHHGDGVQWAFYDSDRVLTVSLHQDGRTLFPGSGGVEETGRGAGQGYAVNLPLPRHTDDEAYLWAFDQLVPPLIARFDPDIVVTQLGVDTHVLDPLAELDLTTQGQLAVVQRLARLAPHWLALGGGGYNLDVVPRAWTLALALMAEADPPLELPAGYRSAHGGRLLHDEGLPQIDPRLRLQARQTVERVVAEARKIHHLD